MKTPPKALWTIKPGWKGGINLGISIGLSKYDVTYGKTAFSVYFAGAGAGVPLEFDSNLHADPPKNSQLYVLQPAPSPAWPQGAFAGSGFVADFGAGLLVIAHRTTLDPIVAASVTISELAALKATDALMDGGFGQGVTSTYISAVGWIPTGDVKSSIKARYGTWVSW
jgi:hypothetical protein